MIIDGANVGYFKQNAADAGELADLKQIDWAVKKYESEVRFCPGEQHGMPLG